MVRDIVQKVDVLIVDDRLDGIIALEAVLDSPNINLVHARSGIEALELLSEFEFGVIILDVQMPKMDGFETAERIRTHKNYGLTPIIFVTAINNDERYLHRGYQAGAVDYIFKPFEPHILKAKVSVFVELFLKSRQLREQAEIIRESEARERYIRLAELELESLRRYRNLADAIPHIVWKARVDQSMEYFNKIWTDYTGLPTSTSLGNEWHKSFFAEDLVSFQQLWSDSAARQQPFQIECRLKRRDGDYRWHWIHAVPESGNQNEIIAWLGTCTDIQDRKITEAKLMEAEKAAVSANHAKTHCLANISHEIRTPLSAILGFAELMMSPTQSDDERIRGVGIIRRSGQQLLKIIDEILDLTKVESGHLEIESIEMNIIALLSELRSLLGIQARSKKLTLEFEITNSIPEYVFSDPTRMRQILMNLVGNSIKFTMTGGVRVEVGWSSGRDNTDSGKIYFRISDTGPGIELAHAERIFQPFVQRDCSTARRFGGTGLGLALSRQLARALGGDAILEKSELEKGSTFLVEILAPLVPSTRFISHLDSGGHDSSPTDGEGESRVLNGIQVLLVDDAPENQFIIGRFLSAAGAEVDIACNGEEGVAKAMAGKHNVILMDIQMPIMDGYTAAYQLQRLGYKRPIIALTAHAFKEDRERCLRVGFSDHLTKPIDRRTVVSEILKVVERSREISRPRQ